jgi:hypothetical protein
MTAPSLTFVEAVRTQLELDPAATSRYSDQTIGSNIRTASWFLERATGRLFGARSASTLKFSTNGEPYMTIPGLRTATSVTWSGSTLTADSTYWLIPDSQQTGVYTGVQLRGFQRREGGPSYLSAPDWFDRGLDMPGAPGHVLDSIPNDLVIVGDWGYLDADMPPPVQAATVTLAAFLTKYPDAVLIGASQTAQGNSIDLSGFRCPSSSSSLTGPSALAWPRREPVGTAGPRKGPVARARSEASGANEPHWLGGGATLRASDVPTVRQRRGACPS